MSSAQETAVPRGSSRGRRWRPPRPRRRGGGTNSESAPNDPNALQGPSQTITPTQPVPPGLPVVAITQRETHIQTDSRAHLGNQAHEAHETTHSSRRGRAARGGRRGAAAESVPQRTFGGMLTSGQIMAPSTSSPVALQADAPEFKPGRPLPARNEPPNKSRPRRMSKSAAPDIATRIHEDIANRLYECAICTSEVLRNSKTWSCNTCWTVFHMSCITKWSKNEGSTQQRQQGEGIPLPRQWRCPGCNLPKDDLPGSYTCWCGKEVDPKPVHGLRPHSCGQTCGKVRVSRKSPDQKCPHPCEEQCHAGPCPPCTRSGPIQPCYCGKDSVAKRCLDTDYGGSSWSCGRICGDLMPCGEHTCPRGCHEGLCGSCEVLVESRCYCGKIEQTIPCCDRGEEKESHLPSSPAKVSGMEPSINVDGSETSDLAISVENISTVDTWIGSFTCQHSCDRPFDCGKHLCSKGCHEQASISPRCPFSPEVITHCPCGKTSLPELGVARASCEDPVPHCQKTCEKALPCGHLCPQKCHVGECNPCLTTATIKCRCGRTLSKTICHQGMEEPPQCTRSCKALLNCGRHECSERCCPAEKIASDRQAAKRKMRLNSSRAIDNDFEAEHICTRACGRPLKCGNEEHICQELCHRGPCGSCREAIFDEIACNCGRTVLHPPLPCGTRPPACQYPCLRSKVCGHPIVPHTCHEDDVCPKCPYLMQKTCMCEKSVLKNQPCWSTQVSCGQICGRRLTCGIHFCQKNCHREGECEDTGSRSCPQTCGQKKTACEHFCLAPCHAPYACKEDKPCQSKIIITCDCGRIKQEVKCLVSKGSDIKVKTLDCDDECLRLARNRKLAQALNVDPEHMDSDHIPYSTLTLDLFQNNVKWSQTQEREFRVFAADDNEKRFRFKPMKNPQRAFLHALAEDFGFDSESLDPEPHRHIIIFKTPRFVSAPMKTLAQCIKARKVEEPAVLPKIQESGKPFNALILTLPRFALTLDDLHAELSADFDTVPNHTFNISFLPSEDVVIHDSSSLSDWRSIDPATLSRLQALVSKTVTSRKLASGVSLCRVDQSLNVLRRETDSATDGWSQVVKGATLKSRTLGAGVGAKSSFTVLGTKASSSKAKGEEKVVENWESAMDGWD